MDLNSVDVRAATVADLPAVADIYAYYALRTVATFDEQPRPLGQWQDQLTALGARGWPFLVAVVEGDVAGYAYVAPFRDRSAYRCTAKDSIYLHPDRTGQGLGAVLLERLLDAAAGAGVREVLAVIADSGSPASIELHSRAGFRPTGTLTGVGRKQDHWIDVLIMQRSLS